MKTTDGRPARAACAATELARLPVEAQAILRVAERPWRRWRPRLTTRSLNECVGLAESSLTHSPPVMPELLGQPVGADQRRQAGVEGHPVGRVLARPAAAPAYRQMFCGPASICSRVTGPHAARGRSRPPAGRSTRRRRAAAIRPKVAPQLRHTRPRAGLGGMGHRLESAWAEPGAVRVMRRLPPHLPRIGPSSRAGRNWHLPRAQRCAGGGCRGFIGPCPSAPLDEWNAVDSTQSARCGPAAGQDVAVSTRIVYTDLDGTMVGPRGSFWHTADRRADRRPGRRAARAAPRRRSRWCWSAAGRPSS